MASEGAPPPESDEVAPRLSAEDGWRSRGPGRRQVGRFRCERRLRESVRFYGAGRPRVVREYCSSKAAPLRASRRAPAASLGTGSPGACGCAPATRAPGERRAAGAHRDFLSDSGGFECARYRIRTCGLWLRRPTLYPAELIAQDDEPERRSYRQIPPGASLHAVCSTPRRRDRDRRARAGVGAAPSGPDRHPGQRGEQQGGRRGGDRPQSPR